MIITASIVNTLFRLKNDFIWAKKAGKAGSIGIHGAKAAPHAHIDEDNEVDGCDLEFHESDATPDHELPPARGGVAVAAKRARSARQ